MKIYFNKKLIIICMMILLVSGLYSLVLSLFPVIVQSLVDEPNLTIITALNLVSIYALLRICHTFLGYIDMRLSWIFEKSFKSNLMKKTIEIIFMRSRVQFNKLTVTEYTSLFNNDIDEIESFFELLLTLIRYFCTFMIYFVFLTKYINLFFSSVILAVLFIGAFLNFKLLPLTSTMKSQSLKFLGIYLNKTRNLLEGFSIFPTESKLNISNYHKKLIEDEESIKFKALKFNSKIRTLFNGYNYIIKILMIYVIVFLIYLNNITIGQGIAIYQFINYLTGITDAILMNIVELGVKKGSFYLLEKLKKENYIKKPPINDFAIIKIKNQESEILIKKGGKYLLRGKNGSGKSTILKELSQITPITHDIEIDKKSIENFDFSSASVYFNEYPIIFSDTFLNNISFFNTYTINDNNLSEFLKLKFQEYTNVKNCSSLSGGEKQLITFFRLHFLKQQLVILDETFSALDTETFNEVINNLSASKKTIVLVAHQANSLDFNSNGWEIINL